MSSNQKLPIVLAHGIARFDILHEILRKKFKLPETNIGEKFQYFKGIKPHLEARGFRVFHPNEDFAGPITLRSEQLRDRVGEILTSTGAAKVHIIAHSMGGLDARHMIVDLEMAGKVASLTTIGTPHLGTVLADRALGDGGELLAKGLEDYINLEGFGDLTITACEQFNARAEDQEARNDVVYQTYASSEELNQVFLPLIAPWILISHHEGRNDGLVPFRSQQWKQELVASDGRRKTIVQKELPFPADHFNQVGWWDPQETIGFFPGVVALFKQAHEYENRIKNLYLEIAQGL